MDRILRIARRVAAKVARRIAFESEKARTGTSRSVREGVPKETFRQKLEKHPNAFVHFSDINKIGINPKYAFGDTPAGLYGYFVRDVLDFVDSGGNDKSVVNFASDRDWAHIFSINSNSILNFGRYSHENCESDLAKLKSTYGKNLINKIERSFDKAVGVPKGCSGKLWYVSRGVGKTMIGWNKVLRSLGYDSVIDDNNGIVSRYQPSCVVVLDTTKALQLDTVHNDMAHNVDEDGVFNTEFVFFKQPDMSPADMLRAAHKVSEVLESIGGVSCIWKGRKLYLGYQANKKTALKREIGLILNGGYGDEPKKFADALGLKVRIKD